MAAIYDQNFLTFAGDDVFPIFTVYDSAGAIVDISTVSDIQWYAKRTAEDVVPVASASKLGGTIAFVTTGVDGRFQVTLTKAVTSALSGFYQHIAKIIDALGNVTTVTVGRIQVGVKPTWTYDPNSIATVALYQARRLIGDVIENDQQLQDAEILFYISERSNIYGAAADACRAIGGQYSRKVDTMSPGGLQTSYSSQASKYLALAKTYENQSRQRGAGAMPYAGGISVSDKTSIQQNTDRVTPNFNIGMTDNFIPIPSGGNQTPIAPMVNNNNG